METESDTPRTDVITSMMRTRQEWENHSKELERECNELRAELDRKDVSGIHSCQERLVSRSFVAEQFARFRANRERQHQIESRRGGSFGIATHKDADAVEWRTHCREVEESQAFLENRNPISECWGESSSATAEVRHVEKDADLD